MCNSKQNETQQLNWNLRSLPFKSWNKPRKWKAVKMPWIKGDKTLPLFLDDMIVCLETSAGFLFNITDYNKNPVCSFYKINVEEWIISGV